MFVALEFLPYPNALKCKKFSEVTKGNAKFEVIFQGKLCPSRALKGWHVQGVLHLHTRNPVIIHGDLRTANILVNSSWHCKVAEFAMARMVGDKAKPICPEAMGIHHLAPEVQLGAETSTQSDVYAFGMMLLELLTLMPCQNTAHLLQSAHGEEVMDIFADVIGGPVYGMLDYLNFTRRCISADPVLRPGFDAIGSQLRKLLYESADVQSAAQLAPESWASASGSLHSMDRVCSRLPGWYDKAASRRTSISPPEPSVLHGYISAFPTPTSVSGCHPMELACMPDGTPVPATPAPAKRGGTTPDLGPPNRWSMPPIPPALYCSPSAGPIPKASSFIRAEAAGCTAQPCTSAAAPCNHVPPPTDLAGSHTSPLRQPPPGKESLGERFALWHFRPLVLHPSHHSLGQAFKPAQGSGKYGADQSQRQHPQARIEAHGLTAPTMPYTNVAAGYADGNQKVAGMQIVPQQCCPAPLWPTDFPRHPQPEVGRHLAALGGQEPKPESPAGPYCGELIFASVPVRSDEPGYAAVPQHMDFCKAVSWPSGCSSDATVLGSNPVSGSKSLQHVNVSCCASVQALHLPCRHSSDARLPLLPSALSSSASGTLPAGWQIPRLPVPGEPCEAFKRG
eukprot:jgi/Botrbrau1/21120/Bobra.0061s0015.1